MPVLAYVLHATVSRGFTVIQIVVPATPIFSLINPSLTCYEGKHDKRAQRDQSTGLFDLQRGHLNIRGDR